MHPQQPRLLILTTGNKFTGSNRLDEQTHLSFYFIHRFSSTHLSTDFLVPLLHIFVQGKKIIGASCASNDAKVVLLSSSESGGTRKYQCDCSGTLNTGASKMYCSIHYWEC